MRFNFAWRTLGTIPLLLLLASSCSVLYDLDADQCSSNDDCVARFGEGYSCDIGICKSGSSDAGAGGKGGGGKAGSSGATGADGGMDEGGTSPNGGTAPTAGSAGTGGTGVVAECATHKECFDLYPDDSDENPRACIEGTCVPLITDDCPVVLPLADNPSDGNNSPWNLLKSTNALILGAFAPFNGDAVMTTQGNNFDFALWEFTGATQGIRIGNGTKKRQIVTVLCNGGLTQDRLLAPASHLMDELKVPALITAMLLQDQSYLWENSVKDHGVFMMNAVYSDQALIDTEDDNLVWNMLSGANALSVSYQPLLDLTEQHLRALNVLEATEDLKVAHVKATDEPFLQDTAAFIEKNLTFNGQSRAENQTAGLYRPIEVESIYKNKTDDRAEAVADLVAFGPHVVIGTTVTEMTQYIIPGIETTWDAANPGQKRPFYLLGALNYGDFPMRSLITNWQAASGQKPLYQRILGINWPSAADRAVYDNYQANWESHYGKREDGFENYYDSMYYLLYGIAAAYPSDATRPTTLTGGDIATGLLRVIQSGKSVPQVDVGPGDDLVNAVNLLYGTQSSKIQLIGAMGPPNWDSGGGRHDAGSVWCVNSLGNYLTDQLRYDESDSSLQPSNAGTIPGSDVDCFAFPAP
jgi:branched-chain amino acid transport system substrate-binding protein